MIAKLRRVLIAAKYRPVRAENHIHGPDQHSCSPGGRPVMITDHVTAVRRAEEQRIARRPGRLLLAQSGYPAAGGYGLN